MPGTSWLATHRATPLSTTWRIARSMTGGSYLKLLPLPPLLGAAGSGERIAGRRQRAGRLEDLALVVEADLGDRLVPGEPGRPRDLGAVEVGRAAAHV